jgi:RecQ family ATP-dependent DNA helicase
MNNVNEYLDILNNTFKIKNFKDEQLEIINNIIIHRNDVCCVLATGYGKSLCYQFPPIFMKKPCIVISPLISLMEDQKNGLDKLGISSCCFNSTMKNKYMTQMLILEGEYQIIYITPEYTVKLQDLLQQLNNTIGISLIAIDEAHCISMWGHCFRSSYRELSVLKKWLPDIPILALTGTATGNVENDICASLKLTDPKIIKASFNRPNLYLSVFPKKHINEDLPILFYDSDNKLKNESSIIYCITKQDTENIAKILSSKGIVSKAYHGGMNDKERTKIHHDFLNNNIICIVATISFGMGINKSDVRMIIHYGSPKDIESYYQEIGRGSRDGKPCKCVIFYNRSDFSTQKFLINDMANEKQKMNKLKSLNIVEKYLYSGNCRRKEILKHFEEEYNELNTKVCCDNCSKKNNNENTVLHDYGIEATILFNTINQFNDRFGLNMILNILKGSKSKQIPKFCFDSYVYGSGKMIKKPLEWWKTFGRVLLTNAYMKERYIPSSSGSVISLTVISSEFLKNTNKTLKLNMP